MRRETHDNLCSRGRHESYLSGHYYNYYYNYCYSGFQANFSINRFVMGGAQ